MKILNKKEDITKLVTLVCQNTTLWDLYLTQLPQFVSITTNYITSILKKWNDLCSQTIIR